MQVTVEQIENEVRQLSREDLRKVRELVDSLLEKKESKPTMTEEEFLKNSKRKVSSEKFRRRLLIFRAMIIINL